MPVSSNIFQKIPFIRITGLFLAGILLNYYFQPDIRWIGIMLTCLISSLLFFWYNADYLTLRIQNLLLSAGIVACGLFYPGQKQKKQLPEFNRKDYYLAEVCQKPAEKAKTFQTILLIQNKSLLKPERVIAYFSKDGFDSALTTGDQVIVLARPQRIKNQGNPFEFDYQAMMSQRGIWYSMYLPYGTYLKSGKKINRLAYYPEQLRDKLVALLSKALSSKEERSVVSALTLGYRTELDHETLDYFASTGAMHVLSVSGLHVALIYYILGVLLAFVKRGKSGILVFSVIMILFLWLYAIITGFSPSVQRATVMFSFVVIGNSLRRPVNIYNSLTASALFLILLNPNVIFDIGFQLSYLAVFGIVLIHPEISGILKPTNPLLKKLWAFFTVSVAAQLATFPLGLYYFNQFPNLFWLSNYAVIPMTTLIIWLTLAFFALSPIPSVALFIGIGIQKITQGMLYVLKEIDSLPYAVSEGFVLSSFQVWLLFGVVIALLIFWFSKRKSWLIAALSMILLVQVNSVFQKESQLNQNQLIVYNTRNLMIHLIDGRNNYLITTDAKQLSESEWSALKRVRFHLGLSPAKVISIKEHAKNTLDDLKFSKDKIQFLNCTLEFISNQWNSNAPGQIKLTVFASRTGEKMCCKTIDLVNSYSEKEIEESAIFRIKRDGAFRINLKNPNLTLSESM